MHVCLQMETASSLLCRARISVTQDGFMRRLTDRGGGEQGAVFTSRGGSSQGHQLGE